MSNSKILKGAFAGPSTSGEMKLDVIFFEEGGVTIAYAPALDLSGSGYSEEEARRSFEIAVEEFIRYTTHKGTLVKVLRELGWEVKGGKKHPLYTGPGLDELLEENEQWRQIMKYKNFHKLSQSVQIPPIA